MSITDQKPDSESSAACPCGSGKTFGACCGPLIAGTSNATGVEALMRSRYTAFVLRDLDYLVRTHRHPSPGELRRDLAVGIDQQRWLGLVVHHAQQKGNVGFVSFTASYVAAGQVGELSEHSQFCRRNKRWFYVSGEPLTR